MGKVLELAESMEVPEQATLPVYIEHIHAIMDIGLYCRDVRSGITTRNKKYFKYEPPGGKQWVMLSGGEIERLGGAEDRHNFRDSLWVAHDGPLASLGQRLMAQGGQP